MSIIIDIQQVISKIIFMTYFFNLSSFEVFQGDLIFNETDKKRHGHIIKKLSFEVIHGHQSSKILFKKQNYLSMQLSL